MELKNDEGCILYYFLSLTSPLKKGVAKRYTYEDRYSKLFYLNVTYLSSTQKLMITIIK